LGIFKPDFNEFERNTAFVTKVKEKTMANKKFLVGMLVIALLFGITAIGCDDDNDDNGSNGYNGGNGGLVFNISNAKALFAGSSASISRSVARNTDTNIILLKETEDGNIEAAVTGITGNTIFTIYKILKNPVTGEIFLLGLFTSFDFNGFGFNEAIGVPRYDLIRIDQNSNWYGLGLSTVGHIYSNCGFDKNGAFYFVSNATNNNLSTKIWKYIGNEASSIAIGTPNVNIHKVFLNGYILYSANDDTFLRAPDGGLTPWSYEVAGIYSSHADVFYFADKGYDFKSKEFFDSGATNVAMGNDFEATGPIFVIFEAGKITKYEIQSDNTLDETIIMSNYKIDSQSISGYGQELFVKYNVAENIIYFAGRDASEKRNLFVIEDGETPTGLLTGTEENNYSFLAVSFSNDGKFMASVQQLSSGKYGSLEGDFSTGEYHFTERDGFNVVSDVLLR
jgi:hypothetical protein